MLGLLCSYSTSPAGGAVLQSYDRLQQSWFKAFGVNDTQVLPKVKAVKGYWWWAGNQTCFFLVVSLRLCRTSAGSKLGSRIHPENVPGAKPGQGQDAVPPLHLRHRHREHPLRLRGRQGHHPASQPEGVQPGVATQGREQSSQLVELVIFSLFLVLMLQFGPFTGVVKSKYEGRCFRRSEALRPRHFKPGGGKCVS